MAHTFLSGTQGNIFRLLRSTPAREVPHSMTRRFHPIMVAFPTWLLLALVLLTSPPARAHTPGEEMAGAASTWLAALDAAQRGQAVFALGDGERVNWHFIPRDRKGLAWRDMTPAQRHLATGLLASGLSQRGLVKAATIMSLEQILLEIEQGKGPRRDPEGYYWTVFGEPSATGTWGWRVEGHHLALNFTIVGGRQVASSPSMFGSNPAEVREGPRRGLRVLAAEEDLGKELLRSLSPEQRKIAVISAEAPKDVITGAERKVKPLEPKGLAAENLNGAQQKLLRQVLEEYARRCRPEVADEDLAEIDRAGFGQISFAWAGGDQPGQGSYYRVQGPTFLLEYDNTQNNANHIHAVWRKFSGDFGDDLLARHYQSTAH